MTKATDELMKTHRVVAKVLEGFIAGKPRFVDITKTLHRTVLAHAWLQDEILLPALMGKSLIVENVLKGIVQEHKDLDSLLKMLITLPQDQQQKIDAYVLQIRTLIETHFKKETDALYPLVEKVLDSATLGKLRNEMERREVEIREVIKR